MLEIVGFDVDSFLGIINLEIILTKISKIGILNWKFTPLSVSKQNFAATMRQHQYIECIVSKAWHTFHWTMLTHMFSTQKEVPILYNNSFSTKTRPDQTRNDID